MKKVLFLLFIFVVIPTCLYFALDRENIEISEFRLNSGYQKVKLTDGITSYKDIGCLLYTSPSPRDATLSRMPSSA